MTIRTLFVSNSPWARSGYGVQTAEIVPALQDMGYEMAVLAFFGLQGGETEWEGIPIFPAGFKPYGNDVIVPTAQRWGADIVIPLMDIWVLDPRIFDAVRMVPYTPIDHAPVPAEVVKRLQKSFDVIAYSKFASEEYKKAGINHHYAPHGVDTDSFYPRSNEERRIARAEYGISEDAFVVGMVAANQDPTFPTRKGFERILPAIANLRKKGYDNLYLYIHTHPGQDMGGVPLIDTVKAFGCDDYTFLPRPGTYEGGGVTREELAKLYSVFDIYAMPSTGEGYGVPLCEAAACGIPGIATDFSACKDICFSDWLIEPVTYMMTPLFSFQAIPSVESIQERIEYAILNPEEVKKKGKLSAEKALEYAWPTVMEKYWKPIMEKLDEKVQSTRTTAVSFPEVPKRKDKD